HRLSSRDRTPTMTTTPKSTAPDDSPVDPRYSRQILFSEIGEERQRRLLAGSALLVGCGAPGRASAELLARRGAGRVRIVDRDLVESTTLQRQILFDEADARALLPKAEAAAAKLRAINSGIMVEGIVGDLTPDTIGRLADGMDVLVDGTDNFETRFLVNDYA